MDRTLDRNRRGVLLLIVLSMLTLFMMLGTTYLVLSTRARKTSKAFADNIVASTSTSINAQRLLDEAFMVVARGTMSTTAVPFLREGNDLLGDKYGKSNSVTGQISGNATGSAIIAMPVSGMSNPHLLPGRVLTFTLPTLSNVSTRILRADFSQTPPVIYLPAGMAASGGSLTATAINVAKAYATGTTHFLVNGREFDDSTTNEPYDGFNATSDPYLAKVTTVSGSTTVVPSFGVSATVDNDGDGISDSGFVDVGFPKIADESGNLIQAKVAAMVIDLDGRLNLNAHGACTDLENTSSRTDSKIYDGSDDDDDDDDDGNSIDYFPNLTTTVTSASGATPGTLTIKAFPRGAGVGPAEISLFGPVGGESSSTGLAEILCGNTIPSIDKDNITQRPRPTIGKPEGRYGDTVLNPTSPSAITAKPGTQDVDDNAASDRWVGENYTQRFFEGASGFGSPSDIKGRMRVWTDGFGQPIYYKPYWNSQQRGNADSELIDDPYEINLSRSGPRSGWVHDPATQGSTGSSAAKDNPYTVADLEGILRYFDPDSMRLPRRLVSICRVRAAAARPLITTESWDTPAVTGTVWNDVIAAQYAALLSGTTAQNFFSPETIMGHKFDLNRPFHDTNVAEPNDATGIARRQQFAKHLYCLLMALAKKNGVVTPPSTQVVITPIQAEQLAQWVVNIIDFRDGDSVMTPFDYDENFNADPTSWTPAKRVWGCERPEILITETLAWHDRRTDDLDQSKKVVEALPADADNDFDQQRRPRGAFFVELYSPWGSQAMTYDTNSSKIVGVTGTATSRPEFRGEPLPSELVSGSGSRFDRTTTINLSLTHTGGTNAYNAGNGIVTGTACPIWRLVSVRGNVKDGTGFGADPFAEPPGSTTFVDPSRQGSGGTADRIFYFTPPTTSLRSEKPGAVFWQSATTLSGTLNPSQSNYVVVGTNQLGFSYKDGPFATGSNASLQRCFDQPASKPATLSEPTATATNVDPYSTVGSGTFSPGGTAIYTATLAGVADKPLDSITPLPAGSSAAFLDSNSNPLLMRNGTHENFAVVHLQRLANPTKEWSATENPYITVDSMPVDLTVVNTSAGNNYDEPGATPEPDPTQIKLTYLSQIKKYRYSSTERGGQNPPYRESDIWSRRVLASEDNVADPDAFRTVAVSGTTPMPLAPPSGPGQPYQLQNRTVVDKPLTTFVSGTNLDGTPSQFKNNKRFPWLFWPNRPFTSAAELALVPTTNAFRLASQHTTEKGWGDSTRKFNHLSGLFETGTTPPQPWIAVIGKATPSQPGVLDFVHVPSRFTGSYLTVSATTTIAATLGLNLFPSNQISQFREPGRVNVNTMAMSTMSGTAVNSGTSWCPLFGSVAVQSGTSTWTPPMLGTTGTTKPPYTPPLWLAATNPFATSPATNLLSVLTQIGIDKADNTANWPPAMQIARDHTKDAYFRYDMQKRMANMVTTRSSVFAVWITIGYFDTDGNEIQPIRRNRAFYIFDRSIPVGYETGKDHNVRDAILLRRIIQ